MSQVCAAKTHYCDNNLDILTFCKRSRREPFSFLNIFVIGKMFVVIPFVVKILDAVRFSKFTYNNSWVMAHLRLLVS
jgi:hypothetical protein